MRCRCLIGGMDMKNFLCIFSRHRSTVQEKAKPNKAQTQEKKIAVIHLWHGRLHNAEPNPGAPVVPRAPHCLAANLTSCWGPAPAQNFNRHSTVQNFLSLTYFDAFCTSAHTWPGAEEAGCRHQITSQSTPQTAELLSSWRTAGNTARSHDFTMEAHRLSLGVSTRGSEVSTNESKTCRALRRPVLRRAHNSWRPCSGFRMQHTFVKP